eukprot:m.307205 g.307205  ORF g.307205 m.307205 type:complete len:93 (-) comp55312_c0_seq9:689-967(-)
MHWPRMSEEQSSSVLATTRSCASGPQTIIRASSLAFSITSRFLFVGVHSQPCVVVSLATRTVVRSYQAHKQSQVFGIACSGRTFLLPAECVL